MHRTCRLISRCLVLPLSYLPGDYLLLVCFTFLISDTVYFPSALFPFCLRVRGGTALRSLSDCCYPFHGLSSGGCRPAFSGGLAEHCSRCSLIIGVLGGACPGALSSA